MSSTRIKPARDFAARTAQVGRSVIEAVKSLADRGRRVFALIVGDGQMRVELEQLAARLGVVDQVIFCGNRDQAWLARVIPAVTIVVSPLTGRALARPLWAERQW